MSVKGGKRTLAASPHILPHPQSSYRARSDTAQAATPWIIETCEASDQAHYYAYGCANQYYPSHAPILCKALMSAMGRKRTLR